MARGDGSSGVRARRERGRVPLQVLRDRKAREVLAEDRHEPEVGVVERVEALVENAPERLEQPDVLEPAVPLGREPAELREYPFTGRIDHERGRGAQELLRALVHLKAELVLEAHGAKEAERIVDEDRVRDCAYDTRAQVASPVMGS
jgi:hypothetical protein